MNRRSTCLLAMAALGGLSCGAPDPEPIVVEPSAIIVNNRTSGAWRDLEVWVNDHYRAKAGQLAPGGRLTIPLDTFVAGFGQRFEPRRRAVEGVEVTAEGEDGEQVRFVWGTGRRR